MGKNPSPTTSNIYSLLELRKKMGQCAQRSALSPSPRILPVARLPPSHTAGKVSRDLFPGNLLQRRNVRGCSSCGPTPAAGVEGQRRRISCTVVASAASRTSRRSPAAATDEDSSHASAPPRRHGAEAGHGSVWCPSRSSACASRWSRTSSLPRACAASASRAVRRCLPPPCRGLSELQPP